MDQNGSGNSKRLNNVKIFKFWNLIIHSNLDETTKSVYKENVRLSEALGYHMKEGEVLKKVKVRLEEENEALRGDKEINEMMVHEKVAQTKNQKTQIKEVS